MGLTRKETRWKRNRKFGDIYGGRRRPKFADNIRFRFHSLKRPSEFDELPILMEDNPSRDFFHPVSAQEALEAMRELPEWDIEGITHIWCRALNTKEWKSGERPWAQFICGRGVRVIVLYAWPQDRIITWKKKPSNKVQNFFKRCGIQITKSEKFWRAKPTLAQLKHFYIQELLYHEVGHHVDWYNRHWSAANEKQLEDYANTYAAQYTSEAIDFLNRLQVEDR